MFKPDVSKSHGSSSPGILNESSDQACLKLLLQADGVPAPGPEPPAEAQQPACSISFRETPQLARTLSPQKVPA